VVSFALNNPVRRYGIIADMPFSEKFLVVLFAQFGASYLLAYLGAQLRIRIAKPPEWFWILCQIRVALVVVRVSADGCGLTNALRRIFDPLARSPVSPSSLIR
jgi:hypothetical protein